jgi:hypothetical protein
LFFLYIAAIAHSKVLKVWTPPGITNDCFALHFGVQRKYPRWELCGFFSVKIKGFTGVKPPKITAVAAVMKVGRAEAIAAAAPQQRKALLQELCEERRKVRDNQGSEARGRTQRA